jgi:hypothetical protein
MQDKEISSCVRETRCARLCIETLLAQKGDLLRGATAEYHGDNQGSIACLQKMTGVPRVFQEVKPLYEVARQFNVDLLFVWKRRSEPEMVLADALSRVVDPSQLFLRDKEFKQICSRFGTPTFDLFAGPNKGEHKCVNFFSLYPCPGSRGVDAMRQSWSSIFCYSYQGQSRRLLHCLFPPIEMFGAVLRKLQKERVNAIVVLPCWSRYWTAMLHALPVVDTIHLNFQSGLLRHGSQVPKEYRGFKYILNAYKVVFDSNLL